MVIPSMPEVVLDGLAQPGHDAQSAEDNELKPANVSSVPNHSPFRYPGGKTWLIPYVRKWLGARPGAFSELVEPFAGGASVALTAAFDGLVEHVTLVERDEAVAAVWQTMLSATGNEFAERVANFEPNTTNVQAVIGENDATLEGLAFRTLVRNRVNRAGILASRAGRLNRGEKLVTKGGEAYKGLLSRWYPLTLRNRILAIWEIRDRITFIAGDGMAVLERWIDRSDVAFFIDPPYSFAGSRAGTRLYNYFDLDHEELFRLVSRLSGDVLMTYNNVGDVKDLAALHALHTSAISMKTAHHRKVDELLIGTDLSWVSETRPSRPPQRLSEVA
jgi:DNA adenine methylase